MILDENLFEAKGFIGTQKGEKRGPYKKRVKKLDFDTIYDALVDRGYNVYSSGDGLQVSKFKEINLTKAKEYLDSIGIEYKVAYKGYPKRFYLSFLLPPEYLGEPVDVLMAESLDSKKLSFNSFVDYLDSIGNSYHNFQKVYKNEDGKRYSGYRYTLSNKLTPEQRSELSKYSNVYIGDATHRYAPELGYTTVVLIDRVTTLKEDTSAKTFSKNLGKDDIQHFAKKNRFNYDVNQLRIDNVNKTYEFGQFKILSGRESTKNGKEFERLVNILKDKGYKEIKSSKITEETDKESVKETKPKTIKVTKQQIQDMSISDALKLLGLTNREERTGQDNITLELVESKMFKRVVRESVDYTNDNYLFKPYWYFTRHGVMPGSVPNYIHILGVVEADFGSYFAADKVIQTKDLEEYEIKEKAPKAEDIPEKVRINIQNWIEYPLTESTNGGIDSLEKTISGLDINDELVIKMSPISGVLDRMHIRRTGEERFELWLTGNDGGEPVIANHNPYSDLSNAVYWAKNGFIEIEEIKKGSTETLTEMGPLVGALAAGALSALGSKLVDTALEEDSNPDQKYKSIVVRDNASQAEWYFELNNNYELDGATIKEHAEHCIESGNGFNVEKFQDLIDCEDVTFKKSIEDLTQPTYLFNVKHLRESFEDEHLGEVSEEIIPDAVKAGPEAGLAFELNTLIQDEWEAIQGYNDAIVTAETEGFHDIAKVLKDIVNEENLHVGQLEQCMKLVSPNTQSIDDGETEAETQLNSVDVVSTTSEEDPEEGMHY